MFFLVCMCTIIIMCLVCVSEDVFVVYDFGLYFNM